MNALTLCVLMPWALFAKTYGGDSSECAFSVARVPNGGYIVAGATLSFGAGAWDILVLKTNPSGDIEWAKAIGTPGWDCAYSVTPTTDGGYMVVGYNTCLILKLNSSGDLMWARSFNLGVAYSVIPTSDNCFAIAGSVAGDIYLLKIDASGNPLWAKRYGNGGVPYEYAYSLIQTSDGGFAIAGYTESFGAGDQDFFVVKTDPSGNMEWARTFGSETLDIAYSIVQTPDGGYAISGYTLGFGTLGSDFLIIRLNASGNLLWAKTVGITDMWEYAGFMALCSDGGYILVGEGIGGFLSVKLNPSGNLDWAITLGGGLIKEAYSVIQDPDGNYTLAGWGRTGPPYDFCIVRVGADGSYPGCANPVNLPAEDVSLTETSPAVTVANPGTNFSVLSLTVTTPALNIADVCVPLGLENQEASCLPGVICSPLPEGALFNSSVSLSIRIYSSDGRLVRSGNLRKGHNRIPLETGVYFWQAEQFKGKVVVR